MLLSMLEALLKRANTPADAESNGPRPCPKLGRPTNYAQDREAALTGLARKPSTAGAAVWPLQI